MLRSSLSKRLFHLDIPYGCSRTSATTACAVDNLQEVLPFSAIPKLPTVPLLAGGWAYLPIIGKYKLSNMHLDSFKKYKQYGSIFREEFSKKFGVVFIYDTNDIEKVFRAEGRYPDRMPMSTIKMYREKRSDIYKDGGLLTTSGQEWYNVRSQTQPHMMKPKAIQAYLSSMDDVSRQFVDKMDLLRGGKNGGEIDNYLTELYSWALESVALVALDTRLGCLESNLSQEKTRLIRTVGELFDLMWKLEFSSFNLWKIFPTPTYKKFSKRMDFFSKTVQRYLSEARQRFEKTSEDGEATFLEQMMSTTKDPRDITGLITDMFFAGIDSTSTTVALTLYHLARNPEAQEKAYQEVKSILRGKELTTETLNEIRYVKACVKESMRATPIGIGNMRTLPEDTVLSGYAVPAGTRVFMPNYVVGLLERNFPEPKRFMPERFLREESTHNPFAFLPFGFGPRACIGKRIAEQEIWTLLIRILERYRMEYHHEDIGFVTKALVVPDRPIRMKFFDR